MRKSLINAPSLMDEVKKIASETTAKLAQEVIRERDKTFSRPDGSHSKKHDPISSLVRAAAAGVGFVSEAVHYRREKKNRSQQGRATPGPEQLNEILWEQEDDAEREAAREVPELRAPEAPNDLAKAFLNRHPCLRDPHQGSELTLPVILVQRRPKARARGFVRAYAPVLADVGIEQETFLDFIDTFNKALEPNPWLYAINLAGLAGVESHEPLMMLLGVGVGMATEVIMEGQSRFRSNTFLDRVNAEMFIPRGVVCLVVTWRPDLSEDRDVIAAVDFDGQRREAEALGETSLAPKIQELTSQMQRITKHSSGAFNWAEPAPLVFSAPGKAPSAETDNAADRAERWFDEHMDKRAQAKWVVNNPNLPMANALPKPGFRSRYADPNHPASSGDIVAFLTGGEWQYGPAKPMRSRSGSDGTGSERPRDDESVADAAVEGASVE
ncbi:hypothetical protein MMYC01_210464 [Madurella mycetomatis]|uniref:Uncharacterized protein n=1 Tax=Madurella mycetomatis TaxID=100816 RepID=A0A175VPH4_9PEZI|nr:hypothetical protein MMYC01_210464 [Madurella mycetomatis]